MARNAGIKSLEARRRRHIACLCILALVGLALLARRLWTPSTASAVSISPKDASSPQVATRTVTDGVAITQTPEPIRVTWPLLVQRDVFQWESILPPAETPMPAPIPATPVHQQTDRLVLTAIIGGHSPQAMINGVLVRPGDDIAGFTLKRINRYCVVAEKDGVQVEVCLRPDVDGAQSESSRQHSP